MTCIICQQNDQVDLVDKTSKESFEKLFTKTRERAEYKDYQVMDFVKRIVNHTTEKLIGDNARNHNKCYANLCKYKYIGKSIARKRKGGILSAIGKY